MKTNAVFLLITFAVAIGACKKETTESKKLLLDKVFENGLLAEQYFYAANKNVFRRDKYTTSGGVSAPAGFTLYQTNSAGLCTEVLGYDKNNQLDNKNVLSYNTDKQLVRIDYYAGSGNLQLYYTLQYNAEGLMNKYTTFAAASNKKLSEADFFHDGNKRIVKILRYSFVGNAQVKNDSSTYVFEGTPPEHWRYYELLPIVSLPNGERTLVEMWMTSRLYYFFNAPPSVTNSTYSNKKYNAGGYLVNQTISRQSQSGGVPIVTNTEMRYEYTE